jgi:hypothetical protein
MTFVRNLLTDLEKLSGGALFVGLLVLLFTAIPARIAEHFGVPPDWAFVFNWSIFPALMLVLVIAVVLVSRWIGQVRQSS